tara:strand:- start:637 stop:1104 length:468 start_codon:yes stop_codon:yes gene_type:complete
MKIFSSIIILFIIISDLFTKNKILKTLGDDLYIVNNYLIFNKTLNKGVAFSLLESESKYINYTITLIVTIIIFILINYLYKNFENFRKIEIFGLSMIIGGGLSNLIDRFYDHSVVDFIIIHYKNIFFPAIFNIADLFISLGILLIFLNYYVLKSK